MEAGHARTARDDDSGERSYWEHLGLLHNPDYAARWERKLQAYRSADILPHMAYETRPFVFNGRPYQRAGSTTSVMPQDRYQRLLLERAHARNRWENEVAAGVTLDDVDQEEILRTVRLGIEAGRLPESTGKDIGDILDRLQLRRDGQVLNATVALFGTRVEQDSPQCHLRLARFKGIDKSEFIDNRQLHGHAFLLLDEAMSFMLRHLPIAGRFEPDRLERIPLCQRRRAQTLLLGKLALRFPARTPCRHQLRPF